MISDKTHKLFEEIAEYIIKLYKRDDQAKAMVERLAKENKEQNATIDVLIKKHSSVQFVNKKLQEKIKRQAERITQLEALYREEIKTKKQEALRERAEKAEEKALKLEQEDAYREMELFSLLNLLDVDKEHQSGLLDMWQTCRILAGKTIKELKANRKMIERMIERVDKVKNTLSNYFHLFHAPNVGSFLDDWNALVAEWKERE